MKLIARIKDIKASRNGVSARTGNSWTAWPVVFEEVNGESEMVLDVFRENLPEGMTNGACGWLMFDVATYTAQNGAVYNQFRFRAFRALSESSNNAENTQNNEQAPLMNEQASAQTAQHAPQFAQQPAQQPAQNGLPF